VQDFYQMTFCTIVSSIASQNCAWRESLWLPSVVEAMHLVLDRYTSKNISQNKNFRPTYPIFPVYVAEINIFLLALWEFALAMGKSTTSTQ